MHLDQLQGVQYYVHCKNTPKLLQVTIAIHRYVKLHFLKSTFRDIDKNVAFDTQKRTNGILKVEIK